MPQGRAKKIQFHLLLADLALKLFDPTPRAGRIGEVGRSSRRLGRCRFVARWAPRAAQRCRTTRLKMIALLVQHSALHT
jgi:hypothetical protein